MLIIIMQELNNLDLLSFITLLITIITLALVFIQTFYAKKALLKARRSIELSTMSKQLEMLSRSNYIIQVRISLTRWREELEKVLKYLKENNNNEIKKISNRKTIKKEGLLDEWLYYKMPEWLAIVYGSGVQYYYNSSYSYKYLWNKKENKISSPKDYVIRFKESIYFLKKLLEFLDYMLPEFYLNCPASLNTNEFFKKK